jgi:hypothetical protein
LTFSLAVAPRKFNGVVNSIDVTLVTNQAGEK